MNEKKVQQAFVQFLAQKYQLKSQQELEAKIQELGEDGLKAEYAEFQKVMAQQQSRKMMFGAKLNYIKGLKGQCPKGYEMRQYKVGGVVCPKCEAIKNQVAPQDPIKAFKCGRKMKKKACGGTVKEAKCGTKVEMDKCGKKMKKKACGEPVKKDWQAGEIWTVKQSGFLPRTTIFRTITYPKPYEAGVPDTTYRKVVSYPIPFIDDVSTSGSVTHDRTGYYNTVGGGRTKAWTDKVSPSGRAVSGQYNQLRNEYNKMK